MGVGLCGMVMDGMMVWGRMGLGIVVGKVVKIEGRMGVVSGWGSGIWGGGGVLGVDGGIGGKG